MKAMVAREYGPPDVMKLEEIPTPAPKENQVLVKILAASVNAADFHILRGKPFFVRLMGNGLLKPKNAILGIDVAGRIEAVGANAKEFQPGSEVYGYLNNMAAFAEYCCVTESELAPKPANMSFQEAAAIPAAAVTALQGLRNAGKLEAGQKVLIHGASGGVGSFAVQIAKAMGAQVTGVCSTRSVEMVRSLGADRVIDYTSEDFTKSGELYDLIFGVNGYRFITDYRRALTPKGRYVMCGGSIKQFFQAAFLGPLLSRTGGKKLGFMGVMSPNKPDLLYMKELAEAGKIKPVIGETFPLSEVPEAMRHLEQGRIQGKVVISVG